MPDTKFDAIGISEDVESRMGERLSCGNTRCESNHQRHKASFHQLSEAPMACSRPLSRPSCIIVVCSTAMASLPPEYLTDIVTTARHSAMRRPRQMFLSRWAKTRELMHSSAMSEREVLRSGGHDLRRWARYHDSYSLFSGHRQPAGIPWAGRKRDCEYLLST